MAAGTVGGLPGLLGFSAAVNAPQAAEMVTRENNGRPMTPKQMARVALLTTANTGFDALGTSLLTGPAKTALGGVGKAALGGAVDAAASDAANRGIGLGESPTLADAAVAGLTGAGTSAAIRTAVTGRRVASEVADAPEANKFRQFKSEDPAQLAAVAKLLQEGGKVKASNAGEIINRAKAITKAHLKYEAQDRFIDAPNKVTQQVDDLRAQGRTDVADAYFRAMHAVDTGQPVRPEQRAVLREPLRG
jgi:hypothetical protein